MKYLCKQNCFDSKNGLYFRADEVYDMPPDWKPLESKKEGVVLFVKLTPAVKQKLEAEKEADKKQTKKSAKGSLPKTGMAASLAEEQEAEE